MGERSRAGAISGTGAGGELGILGADCAIVVTVKIKQVIQALIRISFGIRIIRS